MTNSLRAPALFGAVSLAIITMLGALPAALAQTAGANGKPASGTASGKPASTLTPEAEAALQKKVENYLRNIYAWGQDVNVKPGPLALAPFGGDMYQTTVVVSAEGGGSDSAVVFVSKDGRYIVRGELDDMSVDPFADVKSQLHLEGAASRGPANAKVTVVEFGDLECPVCRQLEPILQQVLPQYPAVRFVFKDFPLESVHPWAVQAAVMGHCALQQSSDIFWKYHDTIYEEQDQITPQNATDMLTGIAKAAGGDTDKLKTCTADPKSMEFVRASLKNGMDIGVNSTPTVFVDGRKFVGPNAEALQQFIEYDLQSNEKLTH